VVTGLTAADFRVYEDDQEQTIDRLIAVSAPFSVAFLADTSASMRFESTDVQDAILSFIERLRAGDRVMAVSFDSRIFGQAGLTGDRARLRRAVFQMGRGQGTRLYDAIELAATKVLGPVPERKAIVVFTDGLDSQSRLATAERTLALVAESHVLVYVVRHDTREAHTPVPPEGLRPTLLPEGYLDNAALYARADQYLADLVEASGGRLYRATTIVDLDEAFEEVARDLREQYTLCYYPANQARDGSYRRIRVEVVRPGLTVRARAGYR